MKNVKDNIPAKIVQIMNLIYEKNMTTISGGNLSIKDDDGTIWITPSGIDKGNLKVDDIVCVKPNGETVGKHVPSVELPFHQEIYKRRRDIKAILHAHPSSLISTSLIRQIPQTNISPIFNKFHNISIAAYADPGSKVLGNNIASVFENGYDNVMLENHGIVVGAETLDIAFDRFEILDFCARINIKSASLKTITSIKEDNVKDFEKVSYSASSTCEYGFDSERKEILTISERIYRKELSPSEFFSISLRCSDGTVLISPLNKGLRYLKESDFMKLDLNNKSQNYVEEIHKEIYKTQPDINSIIIAAPVNAMAFACSDEVLDSRIIPESYLVLRNVKTLPLQSIQNPDKITSAFEKRTDSFIIKNGFVICCGENLIKTYDKLEVLDFSAKAITEAKHLGNITYISQQDIENINNIFNL